MGDPPAGPVEVLWPERMSPTTGVVHLVGCGSRRWTDAGHVSHVLETIRFRHPILKVIEGGAPGADQCVANWASAARSRGVHWVHLPARWDEYESVARWRAGHDRNQAMLDMLVAARDGRGHGVLVLAFKCALDRLMVSRPDRARGGTEDMVRRAWDADVPVWQVRSGHVPVLLVPPAHPAPSLF